MNQFGGLHSWYFDRLLFQKYFATGSLWTAWFMLAWFRPKNLEMRDQVCKSRQCEAPVVLSIT